MKLYVIRHGETRLNVEGRLQGWIDEPLNENGRELARVTGESLKKVPFDMVITSPLKRARETGELAVAASCQYYGRKVPLIEDDRIREIRWGSWDGLGCREDNFEIPSENFNRFYTDALHFEGAPDGESIRDVCERTGEFFREVLQKEEYQDKTILISLHGCALRAMLNPVYEDRENFWQERVPFNCAVSVLEAEGGRAKLLEKDKIYYDESLCIDNYKKI
ncbi:MAG: histidine phosphatase family protein [Eubacteriales bacterium]|nr:histidine phosphatase family protein [Eubacteriales bacterium]